MRPIKFSAIFRYKRIAWSSLEDETSEQEKKNQRILLFQYLDLAREQKKLELEDDSYSNFSWNIKNSF